MLFFFKQKTAYEMRISDWSSDVCSSDLIGHAAWASADPGIQFDTSINDWHTCPADGRINASNPCSEYMFLDDTACNLASLNPIGRASCRESVCQSLSISVVAVSLKQKKLYTKQTSHLTHETITRI